MKTSIKALFLVHFLDEVTQHIVFFNDFVDFLRPGWPPVGVHAIWSLRGSSREPVGTSWVSRRGCLGYLWPGFTAARRRRTSELGTDWFKYKWVLDSESVFKDFECYTNKSFCSAYLDPWTYLTTGPMYEVWVLDSESVFPESFSGGYSLIVYSGLVIPLFFRE